MALNLGDDVTFHGPALPEAFVRHELEKMLGPLLPKVRAAEAAWEKYRKAIRQPLTLQSGRWRVKNVVLDPLAEVLGYEVRPGGDAVRTREGLEGPGLLLHKETLALRAFPSDYQGDLDAPAEVGATYRYTPQRIAERILLAAGERLGLLTNGDELRLVLSDPARPVSFISFRLGVWRTLSPREVPDGFRLLLAFLDLRLLARQGEKAEKPSKFEALLDAARLKQGQITRELRSQARQAVELFVQGILDNAANHERFHTMREVEPERLPRQLWREALIVVYRLLFILRGEASGAFRFATTSPWRHTYSPNALGDLARLVLDRGADTGQYLEVGLKKLFDLLEHGVRWTEANIAPLGGGLFGRDETPLLSACAWSELGCARLLDKLLWTPEKAGGRGTRKAEGVGRRRINYADLDVEDLGRVYEALLELEPGLATEPMVRLRRAKLEVVVPAAQGRKYRPAGEATPPEGALGDEPDDDGEDAADEAEEETAGKKSKVEFVHDITPEDGWPGKFYLRVGLGRKASGSYYTPDSFVRFLVRETLRPQVDERSPESDPQPLRILELKVLDPAMGSGHFLVGACRFLGERLYEACRTCAEKGLWERIPADVVPYLPGRVQEGSAEVGFSPERARAICRRLVAVHCLYGVDKNELAVELAKVCLWLESQAEGMPLTFLDHRLVHGDSLTGPFWHNLLWYPSSKKEAVKGLYYVGAEEKFAHRLRDVLTEVKHLEATIGVNEDDIADKQRRKREVDARLFPFQVAAMVWAGGAMMRATGREDQAHAELFKYIGEHGDLPETLPDATLEMLRRGAGIPHLPGEREEIRKALQGRGSGRTEAGALAFDLTFPEVFYPTGVLASGNGFDAVLGNPPWDALQPLAKEFYAAFDLGILNAPTRRERAEIEDRLQSDPEVQRAFDEYVADFEAMKRLIDRCYAHVNRSAGGSPSGAVTDVWQVFAERGIRLLRHGGRVGWVLPSAFHANQSATGIRELYLKEACLECCYSFENRRKLFEIDSRFKFANVVARREWGGTAEFSAAFYLHDDEWLHAHQRERELLRLSLDFVQHTGGEYLSFLELRSLLDSRVAAACFSAGEPFREVCERYGTRFGEECHMAKDAWRFTSTAKVLSNDEDPRDPEVSKRLLQTGYFVLHEGKTFSHYDDRWSERPRYLVAYRSMDDKQRSLKAACYYRLAFRDIASSTNERTAIFSLITPTIFGNTAPSEREPSSRPTASALQLEAVANTYCFDWCLRQKATTHVNFFILGACPFPRVGSCSGFLGHSALRLTCNHAGYALLWGEQLGDVWLEPTPPFTWPVLAGDDARWQVRAAIDAVVADAYGLNREQYAHVLSAFSHKSYPKAPALCLEKFDELKRLGLDAFTKKHDPYHDIPLNENLPQPVIELPQPVEKQGLFGVEQVKKRRRTRKRKE
jgi:hypothetical protein